ncbi:VOC family protein [uncultured Flavobacterium sp.]|uniref:bleomycin resistance protein n=1 Tax=uncultured Flavobacterium sp. TaxID=165435 RepID=UPI0025F02FE7|nr:VOC family protein [uncultured Flavobacterium sp.]
MKDTITKIIPQLPSLNFEKSKEFYQEVLGCKLDKEYPDLLIFLWDEIELHLWKCTEKIVPENSSCYIHVNDLDAVFQRYQKILGDKIAIKIQPWGMREFYIIDDSGNLFKFGQSI